MDTPQTLLEALRHELGLTARSSHAPQWRVEEADARFVWIKDGERGVALLDRQGDCFELRCASPSSRCPEAKLPAHYHVPTQQGVRILYLWRLRGKGCGDPGKIGITIQVEGAAVVIRACRPWGDGTVSTASVRLYHDAAWDAYVAEVRADLKARRVTTALEYCNVLPAGIGDSRPGREKYPLTFWSHPDGFRKMLKNPLWFNSVGAQDMAGEKRLAEGGFIGFGPEEGFNPVVEVVSSSSGSGCMTCDNLQDEHVMALPPDGACARTGWYRLEARYRLFSVPRRLAEHVVERARLMTPGAFLAWKFQYPALAELPEDLARVALPGSPFYGPSDWSRGIPWDAPYNGRLWTASPDPAAAIWFDRQAAAIRLRVAGEPMEFRPSSGHTLHTDAGVTYRFCARIRTAGGVRARIKLLDMLFRPGDGRSFESATVGPDSDWTPVQAELTARGDDAPFAETLLCAEGCGEAWFADVSFTAVDGAVPGASR